MTEYDFRDNLVTLARFNSPTEAAIAQSRLAAEGIEATLDGGATGTWLNYMGPDLIGATLSVRQGDLRRARSVLQEAEPEGHYAGDDWEADDGINEADADYDADDWSGEDWADDSDDEWDEYREDPPETPPLTRAFRAAVIGSFLFPPVINLYSVALIVRYRLWEPQPGETTVNWRFFVAAGFNLLSLVFAFYLSDFYRRMLFL